MVFIHNLQLADAACQMCRQHLEYLYTVLNTLCCTESMAGVAKVARGQSRRESQKSSESHRKKRGGRGAKLFLTRDNIQGTVLSEGNEYNCRPQQRTPGSRTFLQPLSKNEFMACAARPLPPTPVMCIRSEIHSRTIKEAGSLDTSVSKRSPAASTQCRTRLPRLCTFIYFFQLNYFCLGDTVGHAYQGATLGPAKSCTQLASCSLAFPGL